MTYLVKSLTTNRGGFMPRGSRSKSKTGYHHIMSRGLGIGRSIVERAVKI